MVRVSENARERRSWAPTHWLQGHWAPQSRNCRGDAHSAVYLLWRWWSSDNGRELTWPTTKNGRFGYTVGRTPFKQSITVSKRSDGAPRNFPHFHSFWAQAIIRDQAWNIKSDVKTYKDFHKFVKQAYENYAFLNTDYVTSVNSTYCNFSLLFAPKNV